MKFKEGDWVTTLSGETKQVTWFSEEQSSTIIHSDGFMCYASDCEPWQPKAGEWCWFWERGCNPVLSKFLRKQDRDYVAEDYDISMEGTHYITEEFYSFCEPFIGEVPSFLKE